MSEMEDDELKEMIANIAFAKAANEIANDVDEYIASGQADKDIDESLTPKTWIGRLWERILGF